LHVNEVAALVAPLAPGTGVPELLELPEGPPPLAVGPLGEPEPVEPGPPG
jgi:hypothetical protein